MSAEGPCAICLEESDDLTCPQCVEATRWGGERIERAGSWPGSGQRHAVFGTPMRPADELVRASRSQPQRSLSREVSTCRENRRSNTARFYSGYEGGLRRCPKR